MQVYLNPIFQEPNESTKRYVIMKGSAGSGKSVNVATNFIMRLMNPLYKGANLLCVRKIAESNNDSTFAELKAAVKRICGDGWTRYWDIRENPAQLKCKTTGNRIIFRGMKDDEQREKVKSIATENGKLCWIWIEEATELTETDFDILDDRLRGILPENLFYQIVATFNPVSASHWIKRKFFDNPDDDVLCHHSTYKDNQFIDANYYKRMERRKIDDPVGYMVYGEGRWGLVGGQYFDNWNESIHVVKPFVIPDGYMRFRMMDWGSYRPYCCLWGAMDYDGNMIIYRELYGWGGRANVGTKESSRTVAHKIVELERNEKSYVQYGVLDNACWGRQDTGAPSIAEEINKVLTTNGCVGFRPSVKGRSQVGEEIRLRLEGYRDGDKQIPALTVFKNCIHLIRTLPELTHDKNQPEKYDTNGEDHAVDALGYGCMSRPYKAERPRGKDSWRDGWDTPKYTGTSVWGV